LIVNYPVFICPHIFILILHPFAQIFLPSRKVDLITSMRVYLPFPPTAHQACTLVRVMAITFDGYGKSFATLQCRVTTHR